MRSTKDATQPVPGTPYEFSDVQLAYMHSRSTPGPTYYPWCPPAERAFMRHYLLNDPSQGAIHIIHGIEVYTLRTNDLPEHDRQRVESWIKHETKPETMKRRIIDLVTNASEKRGGREVSYRELRDDAASDPVFEVPGCSLEQWLDDVADEGGQIGRAQVYFPVPTEKPTFL